MSLAGVCGRSIAGMKRGREYPPRGSSAAPMQFDCHLSHEFEPTFTKIPCLSPGPAVSLPVPVSVPAPPLLHHAMMNRCSPPAASSSYSTGHIVGHALHTIVPFGPGIQSGDALRMEDIELQTDQSKNGFTLFISDEPEEVSIIMTSLASHHSFLSSLSLILLYIIELQGTI